MKKIIVVLFLIFSVSVVSAKTKDTPCGALGFTLVSNIDDAILTHIAPKDPRLRKDNLLIAPFYKADFTIALTTMAPSEYCWVSIEIGTETKDVPYKIMMSALLGALNWCDMTSSRMALQDSHFKEGNPLMAPLYKNDLSAIVVTVAACALEYYGFEGLRRENKMLADIILAVGILVKGYIVYHNLYLINHH